MLKIRTTDHPRSTKANSLTPHASVTAAAVLPASRQASSRAESQFFTGIAAMKATAHSQANWRR